MVLVRSLVWMHHRPGKNSCVYLTGSQNGGAEASPEQSRSFGTVPLGWWKSFPAVWWSCYCFQPQQGGLQKSLQSVCTCHYSTHYFHPKPASNWVYLPQIRLQLPFQICRGHYTSEIKNPLFNTFIIINGKPSIACSKYSLDVALSSGLFAGGKSWLHLNVFWPSMR